MNLVETDHVPRSIDLQGRVSVRSYRLPILANNIIYAIICAVILTLVITMSTGTAAAQGDQNVSSLVDIPPQNMDDGEVTSLEHQNTVRPSGEFTVTVETRNSAATVVEFSPDGFDVELSSDDAVSIEENRVEFVDTSSGDSVYEIDVNVIGGSSGGTAEIEAWVNAENRNRADDVMISTFIVQSEGSIPSTATISSTDVEAGTPGAMRESSIKIDAEEGVSIANVEVSIDTSVAEIADVQEGQDVDSSEPAQTFDVLDRTPDSVLLEYNNILATNESLTDFELAKVQFEAQTEDGEAQIGMSSEGVYDGNQNEYGEVELEEGTLTVGSLFGSPLPGFDSAPTNTGELNDTLYEDVNGDGDGLDTTQTVTLWTELVVNGDEFDDLSQEQVDALDWNGDGELTPEDAVSLWTEQVVAGS